MATPFRFPSVLHGVPGRLGVVFVLAAGAWTWLNWPFADAPQAPAFAGKHAERLAFGRDESEIPVREARIYDTIAMFSRPRVEPRPWSEAPVIATMREAGIKPTQLRPAPAPRAVANEAVRKSADNVPRLIQLAADERARLATEKEEGDPARPVTIFGWNLPGSGHLPSRGDAARVLGKVGSGAAAVGSGTARVVTRSASVVGDGVARVGDKVASTGGIIAQTLGLD